jgi:hypothetical protein
MLPCIFVFKKVIGDNIEENGKYGKHGYALSDKGKAGKLFPVAAIDIIFGLSGLEIREAGYQ